MELLTIYFFPVLLGYGIPCLIWYILYKKKLLVLPTEPLLKPGKPKTELVYALLAVIAIFAIGQLWQAGFLIPSFSKNRYVSMAVWWVNNLLIYSPIFLLLRIRRQSLNTIFLSFNGLWQKLAIGLIATFVGVSIYMAFLGGNAISILDKGLVYANARNFLPVFLEGVALAFLFVRLKWVVGVKWAIAIPAVLFSLAHIPRAIANESGLELMLVDSVLTAGVTVIVFAATAKSRDIVWLGILHYFMDIAIGAFN